VWTLLAILTICQTAFFLTTTHQPIPWRWLILGRLADWYTCALFTPAYFWLVRRYPIDWASWRKSVPVLLLATCVFVVIKYAVYTPIMNQILPAGEHRTMGQVLTQSFVFETFTFWCLIGVAHAVLFYERYRDREVQAAELAARLSAAKLEALAGQLHPHFLFNTLQGISTLMHRDPHAADLMLSRLSELLRRTIHRGDRQEVSLREELDLLDQYVGIMKARFGDRLVFSRVMEPGLEDALVPHFILQPLVENALQHGIARRAGPGEVMVEATRDGNKLMLRIRNDGPPEHDSRPHGSEGVGLGNTRLRLQQLYGPGQRLSLTPRAAGGMDALLTLPLRLAPASEAAMTMVAG
jgi:hypothetical protein